MNGICHAAAQGYRRIVDFYGDGIAPPETFVPDLDCGAYGKPHFRQPALDFGGRKAVRGAARCVHGLDRSLKSYGGFAKKHRRASAGCLKQGTVWRQHERTFKKERSSDVVYLDNNSSRLTRAGERPRAKPERLTKIIVAYAGGLEEKVFKWNHAAILVKAEEKREKEHQNHSRRHSRAARL
jgi:hypothetical protein